MGTISGILANPRILYTTNFTKTETALLTFVMLINKALLSKMSKYRIALGGCLWSVGFLIGIEQIAPRV